MGCISSKNARSESPVHESTSSANERRGNGPGRLASSLLLNARAAFGPLEKIKEEPEKEEGVEEEEEELEKKKHVFTRHSGNLRALKRGSSHKKGFFTLKFGRLTEGEHVAAGWPAWLSAVAGEAIDGWLPLRSDTFERLEKIGQGTYSNVYRARNVETGKIFAVKKVRFDNFQPESVRFMAREILILRKLDHPNIMKLEGIITSRLSCHIYLVFEYMEHDLAGLLSCPDIKFTDSQIKCYMRQLLSGVEHCHSRGILHRDIKTSNILVNNEGILKLADFGLSNFMRPKNKRPLTSRVVTLWYRPPELLLGSTNYGEAVDLWSVGCVFAELFIGRPLLKGRTEVEQLHKIFKLCGSPADDYWKRSKLPLASMFKPQHPYESTLRERCKEFPKSAVSLIETFLSIEPHKRGTAASALDSKYFTTKPYACDPASLPKYPPNKEIDAKLREESRRKRASATALAQGGSRIPRRVRKTLQESSDFFKAVPTEEAEANRRNYGGSANVYRRKVGLTGSRTSLKQSYDTMSEASQMTQESQESHGSSTRSVPVQVSASNGFTWPKRQKQHDLFARMHGYNPAARSEKYSALDTSNVLHVNENLDSDWQENDDFSERAHENEATNRVMLWEQEQDSFDSSNMQESQKLYTENSNKKKKARVTFSGPLVREISSRQQDQPQARQVLHRSRFYQAIDA
ncbi:Cdc2-related protein kinase [Handroanthus impetiginosus]|uniref:Cdc2-related protein kinase n=1 Tax=Handroanthus impetiginosus TaxID=429701 RepID=A0A2G9HBY8_9LAMI|nr:Cdc2-related protein kinase [Handroanthus impetiginosus]